MDIKKLPQMPAKAFEKYQKLGDSLPQWLRDQVIDIGGDMKDQCFLNIDFKMAESGSGDAFNIPEREFFDLPSAIPVEIARNQTRTTEKDN
jgi:hypothetical protein